MRGMSKQKKQLTARQEAFCVYRAKGGKDASDAYRSAYNARGMKPATVNRRASELMATPHVRARIDELRQEVADRVTMEAADVLTNWIKIATADPNELIQARRTCCRFCYGVDHRYQWTESELALEQAKAIQAGKAAPDASGGIGFNATLDPYAYCPACFGEGISSVFVADTRKLKGAAKLLYAGVKRTKHGVEIIMRDQDKALENIATYLGMFKNKTISPPGGADNPIVSIRAVTNDPTEASKIYQRFITDVKI